MQRISDRLPVSVLVPTRNSRAQCERHIDTLRELSPHVLEFVVVDSESKDGTVEFLRRELGHARFLSHPPGLYESWNFGVNACAADYIYISTVGDSISTDGLRRMVEVASHGRCDVVISPPRLMNENGSPVRKRWPVFELLDALKLETEAVLDPEQTWLFAVAFMRKAILGSSASNLYRGDCLRSRPFPTDFGHAGDVGWGLRHSAEIRLGILPHEISTFVFHPRVKQTVKEGGAIRVEASRATLKRMRNQLSPETAQLSGRLCDAWQSLFELNQKRENSAMWMLRPSGWRERSRQQRAASLVQQLQREALSRVQHQLRP